MAEVAERSTETPAQSTKASRPRFFAFLLGAGAVLWVCSATLTSCRYGKWESSYGGPTFEYGQITPMPQAEYAQKLYGSAGGPYLLVAKYPVAQTSTPIVRVLGVERDASTRKWLKLEMMAEDRINPFRIP